MKNKLVFFLSTIFIVSTFGQKIDYWKYRYDFFINVYNYENLTRYEPQAVNLLEEARQGNIFSFTEFIRYSQQKSYHTSSEFYYPDINYIYWYAIRKLMMDSISNEQFNKMMYDIDIWNDTIMKNNNYSIMPDGRICIYTNKGKVYPIIWQKTLFELLYRSNFLFKNIHNISSSDYNILIEKYIQSLSESKTIFITNPKINELLTDIACQTSITRNLLTGLALTGNFDTLSTEYGRNLANLIDEIRRIEILSGTTVGKLFYSRIKEGSLLIKSIDSTYFMELATPKWKNNEIQILNKLSIEGHSEIKNLAEQALALLALTKPNIDGTYNINRSLSKYFQYYEEIKNDKQKIRDLIKVLKVFKRNIEAANLLVNIANNYDFEIEKEAINALIKIERLNENIDKIYNNRKEILYSLSEQYFNNLQNKHFINPISENTMFIYFREADEKEDLNKIKKLLSIAYIDTTSSPLYESFFGHDNKRIYYPNYFRDSIYFALSRIGGAGALEILYSHKELLFLVFKDDNYPEALNTFVDILSKPDTSAIKLLIDKMFEDWFVLGSKVLEKLKNQNSEIDNLVKHLLINKLSETEKYSEAIKKSAWADNYFFTNDRYTVESAYFEIIKILLNYPLSYMEFKLIFGYLEILDKRIVGYEVKGLNEVRKTMQKELILNYLKTIQDNKNENFIQELTELRTILSDEIILVILKQIIYDPIETTQNRITKSGIKSIVAIGCLDNPEKALEILYHFNKIMEKRMKEDKFFKKEWKEVYNESKAGIKKIKTQQSIQKKS